MNIGDKSNFVKISYRDGKIVKDLSLNLNDKNDNMFYESYQRLPLDNRNYMASLYAREQEHGVNDATGQRIQELALVTPKEDTVMMREKRTAELESLKESKAKYEQLIKEIRANAMGSELSATEKAQIEEYKKKIDEIKRKIRNIDATWTRALNSEVFRTGHLSGLNPLTRDALRESLDKVAESMSKGVVAFLEDKFEELPAKDDGENGSEQYVLTNAAYLTAMCKYLGFDDIPKLSDAIKRFYGLLRAITKDTLTQATYARDYAESVDDIVEIMGAVDDIDVPGYLSEGNVDVIVEQLKPVAASIKFALGRAAYKTYVEADKRHLPNWNDIKAILDGSTFKEFISIGNEENTFRETEKFKKSTSPYKVLNEAIMNAANVIYTEWQKVPDVRIKKPSREADSWVAFTHRIDELKNAAYTGRASFVRNGNRRHSSQDAIELTTEFDLDTNTLKVTKFKAINTKFEEVLRDIKFPNWLRHPENAQYPYIYSKPTMGQNAFVSTVTESVLSQINVPKDGDLSADVLRKLVSRGSGARYRTLDSPEEKFHNIIDMGNPLKAIRSAASQKRVAISKYRR